MPKKIVDVLGDDADVRAVDLPFDQEEFEVGLFWNQSFDNDPEHQWFRERVDAAVSNL